MIISFLIITNVYSSNLDQYFLVVNSPLVIGEFSIQSGTSITGLSSSIIKSSTLFKAKANQSLTASSTNSYTYGNVEFRKLLDDNWVYVVTIEPDMYELFIDQINLIDSMI